MQKEKKNTGFRKYLHGIRENIGWIEVKGCNRSKILPQYYRYWNRSKYAVLNDEDSAEN